jgi:hypothetical protein
MRTGNLFLLFVLIGLLSCGSAPEYQLDFVDFYEGNIVNSDSITVRFQITPNDWFEKGYNVHVLLDRNHSRELDQNLFVTYSNLTEGSHAIFAFICDKNGISIKNPETIIYGNFYSKEKTTPLINKAEPLLIINQPQKEKFRGDEGFKILFDFLVLNAELGDNYQLHYNLDGLNFYSKKEKPVWIEEARRIGEHKLEVRLETSDGKLVDSNPFNSITKKFLVVEK